MSKMDSKHDGLKCDSARYISNFAENEWLSKQNLTLIKAYFMKIWAGINSNTTVTTLNDLRKETYINSSTPKGRPIDALPLQVPVYMDTYVVRISLLECL